MVLNNKKTQRVLCIFLAFLLEFISIPQFSYSQEATNSAQNSESNPSASQSADIYSDTLQATQSSFSPFNEEFVNSSLIQSTNPSGPDILAISPSFDNLTFRSASFNQVQKAKWAIKQNVKKDFEGSETYKANIDNISPENITVEVYDSKGKRVNANFDKLATLIGTSISVLPPKNFKPGRYTLKITDIDGNTSSQDFTWGVLALNTDKSIYYPNENVNLQMAVLDDSGNMACDAKVSLTISDPNGNISILSTTNGKISVNPQCQSHAFSLTPDYQASYKTSFAGVYNMTLTAETKNGTRSINYSFKVQDSIPFDIQRQTATRIYPPEIYPVSLNIKANQDFKGQIIEYVPNSFTIFPSTNSGAPIFDVKQIATPVDNGKGGILNIKPSLPFKGVNSETLGFGEHLLDPQEKDYYAKYGLVGHDGLDFEMPTGTPVLAADEGTVVLAGGIIYGTTVVIQHSWGRSYYGHLSNVEVSMGQKINRGYEIGLSGNTGLTTGPHLHFGIKLNQNDPSNGFYGKVDPSPYLGITKALSFSDINDTIKAIVWDVDIKKDGVINLSYNFKTPNISPQFYTLGPLSFYENNKDLVFEEARKWEIAADVVANNGRLYYGNQTLGVIQLRTHTNPFTFNAAVNSAVNTTSSQIAYIVAKDALTRDEMMIGHLKVDGRLDVIRCTGSCDAAGDFDTTNNWNAVSSNAMTCTGTTPVDCTKTFDIAYERLSGRAMVVYAGDTSDAGTVPDSQKLYYCYWDGTSWGPVSTCAPTNGSNDITLSSNGRPTYVTLKARPNSNQILLGTQVDVAGTAEAEAFVWSGSSWGNSVLATDTTNLTTQTLEKGNSIDVEWEHDSGDAMIVYGTAATVEVKYKLFSGGSWGSEADAFDTAANGSGVLGMNADRDSVSNRIIVITNDTANDASGAVWKADGSTSGWTTLSLNEATLEGANGTSAGPPYTDVMFEPSGSNAIVVAQNAGAGDTAEYARITCDGTGCSVGTAFTGVTTTAQTDDAQFIRLAGSPNSNDLMFVDADIDRNLTAQHWNGSAWESADAGVLEANVSGAGVDTTTFYNMSAVFVYINYSPWSRNWRWTDDTTTNDPTSWLANEDTAPTGISPTNSTVRLRFNYAELSGMGETATRKKLQYVSSATCSNPNSCSSWADVGAQGSGEIWRYADCDPGDTTQDDDDSIGATRLTDSTANGTFVENGTASSVSGHSALSTIEYDYCVQSNSAASNTTYYFRGNDLEQGAVLRDQRSGSGANTCGPSSNIACTYPSLTTGSPVGPTLDLLMRHGKWFSGGVKQPFTF